MFGSAFEVCLVLSNICNSNYSDFMNLTFRTLKKYFPELNRRTITRERISQVLKAVGVSVFEIPMEGRGAYVIDRTDGSEYVFIRQGLRGLLGHETFAYESTHALCHDPGAKFLKWRHDLQAEVFSIVMMIPATDLPRLNRIKNQLDEESYELIKKRNHIKAVWKI